MSPILIFSIFLLGSIVGSFLNVVIYRYNTGRSYLRGRSVCFSCSRRLTGWDLIPIVSYLCLRGRCRTCLAKISPQYPLIEAGTGLLFTLAYWRFASAGWLAVGLVCLLFGLMVIIVVYDWRHKIIPDGPVYLLMLVGFLSAWFNLLAPVWLMDWWLSLVGGLSASLFFYLIWFISGGRWLGFGDVKLAGAIGLLLGPLGALSALALAFWGGAIVGVSLIAYGRCLALAGSRRYSLKSELPFAPFLIGGTILILLTGLSLFF